MAARWEVTLAVRLSGGTGAPAAVRLALPPSDDAQRLGAVHVTRRGLRETVVTDGETPHVLLRGAITGARRVAVRFEIERRPWPSGLPAIAPLDAPPPALLPFLTPSPIFQSRSLLVRDFLETHVSPVLDRPGATLVRAIYRVTRDQLERRPDGKTLPLDVIRSGGGRRIGIERVFTTFLRCADVPARFVEGIRLDSRTRRKRVFWTEAWADERWWPISASSGWLTRRPLDVIALTRDGQRVLTVENGSLQATYSVQVRPLPAVTPPADDDDDADAARRDDAEDQPAP